MERKKLKGELGIVGMTDESSVGNVKDQAS